MNDKIYELNYCKKCSSFGTWQRNPAGDWHTIDHAILEFSYKCSKCGEVTIFPKEAVLGKGA